MKQQELQAQQQIAQMQAEMQAEENRIKEEDSIRKADTSIQVALIGAQARDGGDGVDTIDVEKLNLQKEKQREDAALKRKQIEETIRQNKVAERQKSEEISIKRKQANKPVSKTK